MITFYYNTETDHYPIYEADLLWIGKEYNSLNLPPDVVRVDMEEYEQDPQNTKFVVIGHPYQLENGLWTADWETPELPPKTEEQLAAEAEGLRQLQIQMGIIKEGE